MNEDYFDLLWHRGLSQRAIKRLMRGGIDSDQKLVRLTEQQMRSWQGCGQKTIDEINDYAERIERTMMRHASPSAIDELSGLGVRAHNCLVNMGIFNRGAAFAAYERGDLSVANARNIGKKTFAEIAKWLGFFECPTCGRLHED